MALWRCVLLGAAGGALVEVLAVLGYVLAWQRARRTPGGRVMKSPPRLRAYIDVPAHVWVLVIRVPLGAMTAWLFAATGQISGPYAALAFGFAAPAVLAQLGRLPSVGQAVQGEASNGRLSKPSTAAIRPVDQVEEVEQS
jgi:hypothetical protein